MGKNIIRGEQARRQAVQIIKDGGTLQQASDATGFKVNYVRQLCEKANVSWGQFKCTDEKKQMIAELARQEYSAKEIAKEMSCSVGTVRNVLNEFGIKPRTLKYTKSQLKDMCAYKEKGHTMDEVADRFGCSVAYAQKTCKGIAPQQSRPEVYRNQYTDGTFDREANAIRYINERTPNFEYAGTFTGLDGYVDLKCKMCGAVVHKSFVSVKHGTAICAECAKRKTQEKREAIKKQKQSEREERKQNKLARMMPIQMSLIPCPGCGDYYIPLNGNQKYCSPECAKRINNAIKKDRRIRKIKHVVVDKNITLERLYKRDKGKCYICGCTCDWDDCEVREDGTFVANDNYPSIDHVKPLSKGGKHAWSNVRLACRGCNSKKSDTIPSLIENGCV